MNAPDNLVEKTLWWTKWQTWFAGLGVLLAIVFGWPTVKSVLVAAWSGLSTGVQIPAWVVLVLAGGAIWIFKRPSRQVPDSAVPPIVAPKLVVRSEEASVEGILWRWRPNRTHGRVGFLKPFCPHCDMELSWNEDPGTWRVLDRWNTTLYCPRCPDTDWSFEGKADQVIDLTRKAIEAGLRQEEAGRG